MKLPVVNHEDYFAKIGDDHKFPIRKFGELANYLIHKKIVKKFYKPYPCSDDTLKRAHSETYINDIKNKTLDQKRVKKIGFPFAQMLWWQCMPDPLSFDRGLGINVALKPFILAVFLTTYLYFCKSSA